MYFVFQQFRCTGFWVTVFFSVFSFIGLGDWLQSDLSDLANFHQFIDFTAGQRVGLRVVGDFSFSY